MPADQSFLPGEGRWRVDAFLLTTWRQGCRAAAPRPRGAAPAVWAGAGQMQLLPGSCVTSVRGWELLQCPGSRTASSSCSTRILSWSLSAAPRLQSGRFYSLMLLGTWVSWLKSLFFFFFLKHNFNCIYICTCVNVCVHTNKLSTLWREEVFLFYWDFKQYLGKGQVYELC